MIALGIIDVQNDFMNPDGALYVPGAEKIKNNIKKSISEANLKNIPIFFTADNHDGTEPEMSANGGIFPFHCIQNTRGQENIEEAFVKEAVIFDKKCYNVFDSTYGNEFIRDWLKTYDIKEVVLIGVVGNICVEAAALGLIEEGIKVTVVNNSVVWMHIDEKNNEKVSRKKLTDKGVNFVYTISEVI